MSFGDYQRSCGSYQNGFGSHQNHFGSHPTASCEGENGLKCDKNTGKRPAPSQNGQNGTVLAGGGEVRRTVIVVELATQTQQAPFRSDIIGIAAGRCRPDGAGNYFGLGFYKYAAPMALGAPSSVKALDKPICSADTRRYEPEKWHLMSTCSSHLCNHVI